MAHDGHGKLDRIELAERAVNLGEGRSHAGGEPDLTRAAVDLVMGNPLGMSTQCYTLPRALATGGRIRGPLDAKRASKNLHAVDSIYWVISRDCNQRCPHCYNDSAPGAPGLTLDQASRCIANLPDPDDVPLDRIIISGGEVLVWPDLLFHALAALYERYGDRTKLMVQTNGDLLDEAVLDRLLALHVCRIDVSSMDRYHPKTTLDRREYLTRLLESRGMVEAGSSPAPRDTRSTPAGA